jgi:hypothetical protein
MFSVHLVPEVSHIQFSVAFHVFLQLEWGFSFFTPSEDDFLTAVMVFMCWVFPEQVTVPELNMTFF